MSNSSKRWCARLAAVVLLADAAACVIDDPLPPPPPSGTGPITGGATLGATSGTTSNDGSTGTSETGSSDGCDPLDDPVQACGPGMRCDVETLMCVPAPGTGVVDDECVDDDQCAAPLVCVDGRCRELCATTQQCANGRICTVADAPLPGLCLAPCNLLVPNCSTPTDACKRGVDADGELVAVCTHNPGAGVEGSACERDGDCEIGFVCTPANQHTLPCAEDAAACCAALCDVNQLPCFGLEPSCILLGIADQPDAGYCGAT